MVLARLHPLFREEGWYYFAFYSEQQGTKTDTGLQIPCHEVITITTTPEKEAYNCSPMVELVIPLPTNLQQQSVPYTAIQNSEPHSRL